MQITTEKTVHNWKCFTLTNDHGMTVSLLNFGGIITKIITPDKDGKLENVVLGYKNLEDYQTNPNFFGALIGRVAGRIPNSSFIMDGKTYNVDANEGNHHLHGGVHGFNNVIWNAETFSTDETVGVRLTHTSPDGEGGYPGTIHATVTYTLTNHNELVLDYQATTDVTTAFTLTNHTYFNLTGDLKHNITDHEVKIASDTFVELDEELIPTGKPLRVDHTPFDFQKGAKLKEGIHSDHRQNQIVGNGYDHYFIFNQSAETVHVSEKNSGRTLSLTTDQPGMVMYTGNSLDKGIALAEGPATKHLGVCFETQGSPASLEYEGFPEIRLEAGEEYRKRTVFAFGIE